MKLHLVAAMLAVLLVQSALAQEGDAPQGEQGGNAGIEQPVRAGPSNSTMEVTEVSPGAPLSMDPPSLAYGTDNLQLGPQAASGVPGQQAAVGHSPSGLRTRYPDQRRPSTPRGRRCWINGRYVNHGQLSSVSTINPCWKKLCWNGNPVEREDGCYYENQCYPVNRDFRYQCATMRCTKISRGAGLHTYRVDVQRPGCQDYEGRCRRAGERNFRAVVRLRLYDNCQCLNNGYTMCFRD